jgi:hypothetical protein
MASISCGIAVKTSFYCALWLAIKRKGGVRGMIISASEGKKDNKSCGGERERERKRQIEERERGREREREREGERKRERERERERESI